MLPKKAGAKFFPFTKVEYSHKKNHAISVLLWSVYYAVFALESAVASLRAKITDPTIQR